MPQKTIPGDPKALIELLEKLSDEDPEKRPSMTSVLYDLECFEKEIKRGKIIFRI